MSIHACRSCRPWGLCSSTLVSCWCEQAGAAGMCLMQLPATPNMAAPLLISVLSWVGARQGNNVNGPEMMTMTLQQTGFSCAPQQTCLTTQATVLALLQSLLPSEGTVATYRQPQRWGQACRQSHVQHRLHTCQSESASRSHKHLCTLLARGL